MENRQKHSVWTLIAAAVALVFGTVTILRGGSVLLDLGGARQAVGHIVPIVLPLVFLTGFLYVAGGIGLLRRAAWAPKVFLVALVLLVVAGIGLIMHVQQGLPHETRTTVAVPVRTLVTALLYMAARAARRARKDQTIQP